METVSGLRYLLVELDTSSANTIIHSSNHIGTFRAKGDALHTSNGALGFVDAYGFATETKTRYHLKGLAVAHAGRNDSIVPKTVKTENWPSINQ